MSAPGDIEELHLTVLLGRGGMGEVWLAHDTLLDRPVAVKLIAAARPDAAQRARFFVEARAVARLSHPNVVTVHRVGEHARRPYIVSEYVRGASLDRLEKPLPEARALAIAVGLARGLAAAHRRGVLHRDVKPANAILGDDGVVKVVDFGLAKLLDPGSPELPPPLDPPGPPGLGATLDLEGEGPLSDTRDLPARDDTEPAPRAATEPDPSGLTARGAVFGSPPYMPPEAWRGEPATAASDLYSFGALLFELCAGTPPHHGVPLADLPARVQEVDAPALQGVDARLSAVVARCLARDPAQRFPSADALLGALEAITAPAPAAVVPEGCPYRGLLPFEAEHRALLFGRDEEARAVIDRLRGEPLVVVAGDSGAGKSSLCRAGVLPRIADGALGAGAWQAVTLVPGAHPRRALAAALLPWVDDLGAPEGAAARLRQRLGRGARLVLFVDQMEELVTLARPDRAEEAALWLATLLDQVPQVRLLATARGDALGRLAALPGLGERLSRGLFFLGPLRPAGLREAIVGPARARGVRFASGAMVEALASAELDPGGLPLLSFALAELWEKREGEVIPAAALDHLGGWDGALARHAERALDRLGEREAARRALTSLVTAEGTRARRGEGELRRIAGREVVDALVRERLVTARRGEGGDEGTYELAHEVLIEGWPTLRAWLQGDAQRSAVWQRVAYAAAEWARLGRSPHALWDPARLAEAAILDPGALDGDARAFLDASRRLARRRRARRFAAYAALPVLLAGVFGGAQIAARLDRARRVDGLLAEAAGARADAMAREDAALRAREIAVALFDAGREAEAAWADALRAEGEAVRAGERVVALRERAFLLDPTRADLRASLAASLAFRARFADRAFHRADRDALLARAAAYDPAAAAAAPAHLVVVSSPGAAATIALYRDDGGRLLLEPPRSLDLGREVSLAPGSFLLTLTAPGRPTVRAPLLLHAGERRREELRIPAAVPQGFVYLPPGRFLTGSADAEEIRRWLFAAPAHEVGSAAFLISRTEVTFADWMAFLRALPPELRGARLPHVVDHFQVADRASEIALTEEPDGAFVLTLQPTRGQLHVVREGERLRYPGRATRAEQDFRAFPVTGISWEDAAAYLAWLSASGRVPGARFCTEREWERAARGADGRIFPHGDRLAPDDAAFDETYGRSPLAFGPDEVGSHPASDSPFGVADLAGNAWELTAAPGGGQALRGGSWYQSARTARSDNRVRGDPTLRTTLLGLRVCADPPQENEPR